MVETQNKDRYSRRLITVWLQVRVLAARDLFRAYVQQMLAPALQPGDVIVMDNLAAHKVAGVAEAIRAAGASLLYLPAYSPDLNPIEMAISKVKSLLRTAERRSIDALQAAIGEALSSVTPDDATAYIRHCRYGDTKR